MTAPASTTHPTRRRVTSGVAWTVPAILAASAAPAVAASCNATTPVAISTAGCTNCGSSTSNPQSGGSSWIDFRWPDGTTRRTFQMFSDSQSLTTRKTVTTTFSFTATAGKTYEIDFYLMAGQGYTGAGTCTTFNSDLTITGPASVGTIPSWSTDRTTGSGPSYLVPGDSCTPSGTRNAVATRRDTTTETYVYRATTSGTVTFTLSFTMAPTTSGNNDDWWVAPVVTTC